MNLNPFTRPKPSAAPAAPPDLATAIESAITAERAHVAAVLALDEAEGRRTLAVALACDGISVEDAKVALIATPTESPAERPWQIRQMEQLVQEQAVTDEG